MKERTLTGKLKKRSAHGRGRARMSHRAAGAGHLGAVAWTFAVVLASFALAFASQVFGR